MKHLMLICGFMLFAAIGGLQADQLAYVTEAQAQSAVYLLTNDNITEVVLWCACCSGEAKTKINVTKVSYRYTGFESFYEVVIEGITESGVAFNEPVDLAYVHIRKKNKWRCLGKALKFKCDPCTKPFKLD